MIMFNLNATHKKNVCWAPDRGLRSIAAGPTNYRIVYCTYARNIRARRKIHDRPGRKTKVVQRNQVIKRLPESKSAEWAKHFVCGH